MLELFSGIGAYSKALTNLGIPYEIVDAVEIDKFAIKSYNAIHGTSFEPQDITQWNKPWYCLNCHKLIKNNGIDTYELDDSVDFIHKACGHLAVSPVGEVDLLCHSSPCQDLSVAGCGRGADNGSGTRSSLMYESRRIINLSKPKFVIWENVKGLLSKKHIYNF